MSKRRLIMYNDARHYHMYIYEPPMRLEDAWRPIDEIAGTAVDTFAYGFGVGPTMFHDTKVGEIWGTRFEKLPNAVDWRAYENIMTLINRGYDPLKVIIDRTHEKGLEFFGSLRMTHSSDPKLTESTHNWKFKIEHPEWCLKGPGKHCFNWVHPEVRDERFALIEETLNRYDIDGFEVDLTFDPSYFEPDEVEQNRHILTDFMRDVRRASNDAATKRGRSIALGARVFPVLSTNLDCGFDIEAWLKEKLLDFVVPNIYAILQTNSSYPFEWLIELAHSAGCAVYPALNNNIESEGRHEAGIEHYRGAAAAYWQKGADGLYLPWFPWPIGPEQRQLLTEIEDPDLLHEQPKHYVVPRYVEGEAALGYVCPLPMTIQKGDDPQTLTLYVADDPQTSRALLKLRLGDATTHDSITVSLNGQDLSEQSRKCTIHQFQYIWFEYPLQRGLLKNGTNQIAVALHSRPDKLVGPVHLESVELKVDYAKPQMTLPL